ncbi:HDIG domain-containing protein [Erythrobacter sanguineus]|jgi:putative nucleotidyltransferase with HDIG domain|uniref:HDIG domain-containing protein n=2 Tax=Erythrobacter sanguineus TaxID=198312 RepID=A0A1M7RTW3_9SPHN|nr:HDIG domain-containing protein [Erythrobacter sanguineus]
MYVCSFGGSFFSHPFWRKRFTLTSQAEVDRLRNCAIPYVEIDDELGVGPIDEVEPDADAEPYIVHRIGENRDKRPGRRFIPGSRLITRADRVQHARAVRTVSRAKSVVTQLFDSARLGKAVPVAEALSLVREIDGMFDRGENMLLDVIRMKTADEYTYLHSVAVCALMIKLARHLGMPETETRECGLAGLLHDVGKMRIPAQVLHKQGALTDDEFERVKSHAQEGFLMLQNVSDLPAAAADVARLHHEKIDGSGYPLGLAGEDIPMIARMGAICDVYDALTSNRSYKTASSPAEALAIMYASTGHFDRELLQAFALSIDGAVPAQAQSMADCPDQETIVTSPALPA